MPDSRWRPPRFVSASIALHGLALIVVMAEPGQWRWVLAAVLADHALLAWLGLWPRSAWLGANWTKLPAAATARNEIALTLDDGPDPAVTPQVLDLLDRYAARATFFCCGDRAQQFPDLCREIVRRGHAVENHSQRHRHQFSLLGYSRCLREVQAAQDTLTAITGQRPVFFRAPAGLRNLFLDPVLARLELQLASWSTRAYDTRIGDAERVSSTLLRGVRAGAILLLHDGNAARTREGVPVILEVLPTLLSSAAAAGLHFVTLRDARPMPVGSLEQAVHDNNAQSPWYRQISAAIFKHGVLKGAGTMLFIGVFFAAYFYLLKNPAYPTTVVPITWLDRLISFQPQALPIYVSLWVYVSLPPALLLTRRELCFYGMHMAAMCLVGLLVFYFWPTAVPAANIDWTRYADVVFLKRIDASGNACPSLHVATAVFSGIWLNHLLRQFRAPAWIRLVNWTWCVGIAYSTLATRQHVAMDVFAGLLLGMLAAYLSLRKSPDAKAAGKVH